MKKNIERKGKRRITQKNDIFIIKLKIKKLIKFNKFRFKDK